MANGTHYNNVRSTGNSDNNNASNSNGVAFGFSLGYELHISLRWWLRSPNMANSTSYYYVQSNGNGNNNNANNSYGVAFGSSQADRITDAGEIRLDGEKESMTFRKVNIYPDVSGRTLLAWQRLLVIPCFMPGDTMQLS